MFIQQPNNPNNYEIIPRKAEDVVAKLEAGVYNIKVVKDWSRFNVYLELNTRYKKGKTINTGVFKEAREHTEFFLDDKATEARNDLGLMHKLALIFNGGPGTGKTYLAGQLMEELVTKKNAICIMSKGEPNIDLHELIDWIRLEDPDRFVGILIDEYEKRRGDELDMLSFLDGTNSRNNMLMIATVNSTAKLPETIINRIGRIERVYNFDTEDTEVIKAMIDSVIPDKYKDKIKAEDLALEFIDYGIKQPTIDFITILIRNKIYEILSGKDSPMLLENIKKAKERKENKKKKIVGFNTNGDNRAEESEVDRKKREEKEAMVREAKEMLEAKPTNPVEAMIIQSLLAGPGRN